LVRAGLVLCSVLLAGLLALPQVAGAFNPDPQLEGDLIALTNADRTSNGVAALMVDDRLVTVARERSDDMMTRNYFAHEIPPTGSRVFDLILARGVDYQYAAENIGYNNAPRRSNVSFMEGEFLRSPGHRQNLLRDYWNFLGIGAVPSGDRVMYTVLFMKPFPNDPSAARLAPPAEPQVGSGAQDAVETASPFEQVVDRVLGRELGIPGID
jgi:hypothetical protein